MIWSIAAQWVGILCLLLWGFWLCCKLRLPAGFGPVAAIGFVMVVLQVFGSVHLLWLGTQLLLVGAVLLMAHRKRQELITYLLHPGVLAFVVGVAVLQIAYAIRAPQFETWDEFSHWGVFFKSVFYDHQFALWQVGRSLAHPAYPQGLPALYALFSTLIGQSGYAEKDVFFAVNLPLLGAASALLSCRFRAGQSRRASAFYRLCAVLGTPLLFWIFTADTPYTTAYMDAPVGALFAAALVLAMLPAARENRVRFSLGIGLLCAAVTTVKEIGGVFALCVLGIWLLRLLLEARPVRHLLLCVLAAGVPVGLCAGGWKLLLAVTRRGDDQFSHMGLGYFLQCWAEARSGADPYFYEVWGAYFAKFRTSALLFGFSSFKLGLLLAVASVVLAIALYRLRGRQFAVAPLCMCLYWPCYQGVLFYVYLCGMSAFEAMKVASYERYACCFFIGWFAVLACGLLSLADAPNPRLHWLRPGVAAGLAVLGACGFAKGSDAFSLPHEAWRENQIATAAAITGAIGKDAAELGSVWILSADEETAYQNMWYYQYELSPYNVAIEAQSGQAGVDLGYNIAEHDVQFLVLFGATQDFTTRYAAQFGDGLAAAQGGAVAVYEVYPGEGGAQPTMMPLQNRQN